MLNLLLASVVSICPNLPTMMQSTNDIDRVSLQLEIINLEYTKQEIIDDMVSKKTFDTIHRIEIIIEYQDDNQ